MAVIAECSIQLFTGAFSGWTRSQHGPGSIMPQRCASITDNLGATPGTLNADCGVRVHYLKPKVFLLAHRDSSGVSGSFSVILVFLIFNYLFNTSICLWLLIVSVFFISSIRSTLYQDRYHIRCVALASYSGLAENKPSAGGISPETATTTCFIANNSSFRASCVRTTKYWSHL